MTEIAIPDLSASMLRAGQARIDASTARLSAAAGSKLDAKTLKRIDESAQDFEAVFLSEMVKPMFEGIDVDENFGGGHGEEVFRDLMVQEYGKNMAKAGGIGIASHIRDELIRQQEGKHK